MKCIPIFLCIFLSSFLSINAQCYLETLSCGTLKASLENVPEQVLKSHNLVSHSKGAPLPILTFSLEKEVAPNVWKKIKQVKTNSPEAVFKQVEKGVYRATSIATASIGKNRTRIHGHEKKFKSDYDGFSSNVVEVASCQGMADLGFKASSTNIMIRPNPVNDVIYLSNLPVQNGELTAFIYDLGGRILLTQQIGTSASEIRVTDILEGVYFLKVQTDGNEPIVIRKVAIVR